MRIRTIKPDFWANEKMAKMPDFARLLAIGLLNYADDEGYFWSNPLLVRSAIFPFMEDSSSVPSALQKLSMEGYIRLGKTQDGREVGHVIHFVDHQVISHGQTSKIAPLALFTEDSSNLPVIVKEDSIPERKGKEQGKEGDRDGAEAPLVPFPSEAFAAAWSDWLAYRCERKFKGYTTHGLKPLFARFADWGEARSIAAMKYSAAQGWQGIFEEKTTNATNQQQPNSRAIPGRQSYVGVESH